MNHLKLYLAWIQTNWFDVAIIVVVTALLYWIGSILTKSFVRHAVQSTRSRSWHQKDIEKRQNTLSALFVTLWRILIVAIGILFILGKIPGVNLAPLFASAGIIGVAIGFGSQSLVKDFLSGIFIVSDNQYRVGDIIQIGEDSGTVERIGTRTTVMRDADGNVHYFPNGSIQHVVNKTMGYSMARFSIAVLPSNDLDETIAMINEIGAKLASEKKWQNKIIDAPAFVSIGEFTGTSVSLMVAGKTQPSDQWSVVAEMRRRLLTAFEAKEIALAGASAPAAKK
jgi:small conductance mechanosensitive channel